MMRTLVLNAGFEPMHMISWQRAICLVLTEKAEMVSGHTQTIRTVTKEFTMPSVIRLKRYVQLYQRMRTIRCSRKNIFSRDQHTCQYCDIKVAGKEATVDHVIPRSKGGGSTWNNLVTACRRCNIKKGSKKPEQVGLKLKKKPRKPGFSELIRMQSGVSHEKWDDFLDLFSSKE